MKRFLLLAFLCASFVQNQPAYAQDHFDQLVKKKQFEAERKRQASFQKAQEVQDDPQAYYAKKNAVFSVRSGVESFKVSNDGHYYVPAEINDKGLTFMADTGASGIFISQSDARKVGINPQTLQYNQNYVTANGAKGRAAMATAKNFEVGSIRMQNVPVIVSMENNHIALLGMEFFGRLKRYEVSGGEMSLYE
jgi:clan AA aspartic protease (TIGR02281 family)